MLTFCELATYWFNFATTVGVEHAIEEIEFCLAVDEALTVKQQASLRFISDRIAALYNLI